MSLTKEQITLVEQTLKNSLRNKFQNYKPETSSMPFHIRLLGKDRLALYSFIHSLSTNFGTSIFEPVAAALASTNFSTVKTHTTAGDQISEGCLFEIQKIMDNLTVADTKPNKENEIKILRENCNKGKIRKVKPTKVDVFLKNKSGELFLFDLKTAKPNKGGFKEFKRTLLEWAGVTLTDNPKSKVNTFIAIPYNPYSPKPYSRWTMAGMLDLDNELKVAEEFWDFLGGKGTYEELLECFEKVGIEMREEIDNYFSKFNR